MTILLPSGGDLERIKSSRIMDDFRCTMFGKADAWPELWQLQRLGGDLLHAAPLDGEGVSVQSDEAFWLEAARKPAVRVFDMPVSAALAAMCLGRDDLFPLPGLNHGWTWAEALQWLVFYGIREHFAWRFATIDFVRRLRRRHPITGLSALHALILAERPDVLRDVSTADGLDADAIDAWVLSAGIWEYGWFWLVMPDELLVALRQSPERSRQILPDGHVLPDMDLTSSLRADFSRHAIKLVLGAGHLIHGADTLAAAGSVELVAISVKPASLLQGDVVLTYGNLRWVRPASEVASGGLFLLFAPGIVDGGMNKLTFATGHNVLAPSQRTNPAEIVDNQAIGWLQLDVARIDAFV